MAISWSAMRKKLEKDNICTCLKGRIQYFATRYHDAHDDEGRVAIRFDGTEVLKSSFYKWQAERDIQARQLKAENECTGEIGLWDLAYNRAVENGCFDRWNFYEAFYEYENQSIEKSLESENILVRLFAVFDKRTGKRRINRINENIGREPEWFRFLFSLRYNLENGNGDSITLH